MKAWPFREPPEPAAVEALEAYERRVLPLRRAFSEASPDAELRQLVDLLGRWSAELGRLERALAQLERPPRRALAFAVYEREALSSARYALAEDLAADADFERGRVRIGRDLVPDSHINAGGL
jgi:hypothetical protein